MADVNPNLAIRKIAVAVGAWTPIVCAIPCSELKIQNVDPTNAVALRTGPNDSGTEKTIALSTELTLRASALCFGAGTVVGYLQPVAGVGPVVLTFIR